MSKYSKQFKLKVVKEFLKFGDLKRVGHVCGISHSDVRKWALAYQAHRHSGLNPNYQRHFPGVQSPSSAVHGQVPSIDQQQPTLVSVA